MTAPMRRVALLMLAAACTSQPPALHDDPQSIAYRSRGKVPDAAARQIAAQAVGDARRRPAWSEPNHVHAADGPIASLIEDLQARSLFEDTLVIVARKDDRLVSPVQFVTGDTPFSLKSWTQTGLANFSGTAIYAKTFNVPENYRDKRVMLDLGRVSSVADVFVNGEHAGTLVWRPYQLDITKFIKLGENAIKIFVIGTSLGKSQRIAGFRNTHPLPNTFPDENFFVCCDAMSGVSSA